MRRKNKEFFIEVHAKADMRGKNKLRNAEG